MSTVPPSGAAAPNRRPYLSSTSHEHDLEQSLPEEPQTTPTPGKLFPCRSCGAQLVWDPAAQALHCAYCGHQEQVPQSAEQVTENSYEDYLQHRRDQLEVVAGAEVEVTCHGCGAVTMMAAQEVTRACPFCGVHLESPPHAATPYLKPAAILPFLVDRAGAQAAFRRWLASRWFAPDTLKQVADLGRLTGLYTPYWTYDAMTVTFYSGARGTHFWESETFTTRIEGRALTRTRQVRRTRWQPVHGQIRHWFDDVLVLASRGLPQSHAHALEPWDLSALVDFKPEYLSGFRTERYQVDVEEGFARARKLMEPVLRNLVCRDIGGDAQSIKQMSTQYSGVTFKHLLLPLWIATYRHGGQLYRILINARTGEVQGSRPYSAWKVTAAVVLALCVVALYLLLESRLL